MGRRASGRRPKYRSESHGGVVHDFGTAEIWTKSVVVRAVAADIDRYETVKLLKPLKEEVLQAYVLRNRTVAEGGVVASAGTFNQLQCPIDVMSLRGLLGDEEATKRRVEAAEALYELWHNAGISGKTTATWGGAGGGGLREQEDWAAIDEMRYHNAVRLIGPYGPLVTRVCIQHKAPPARAQAIEALNFGLDLLARHFGKPYTTSSRHEKRAG